VLNCFFHIYLLYINYYKHSKEKKKRDREKGIETSVIITGGNLCERGKAMTDEEYMGIAIEEAWKAEQEGEIPIGAVLVYRDVILACGHNRRENDNDPTAHAEIQVIREGAAWLGRWRLTGCTLYVTIEPCPMCAGAIMNARLDRVVYGSPDTQFGCASSVYPICRNGMLNHEILVDGGVREKECRELMDQFFQKRRD
jgi:tRNA(adenine34) deaminase